jgi:hypothetical protein
MMMSSWNWGSLTAEMQGNFGYRNSGMLPRDDGKPLDVHLLDIVRSPQWKKLESHLSSFLFQ